MDSLSVIWTSLSERRLMHSVRIIPRRMVQCCSIVANLGQLLKLRATILQGGQRPILERSPLVIYQFLGSYLATSFSLRERLDILLNHYSYMNSCFSGKNIGSVLCNGIVIWNETIDDVEYAIDLKIPGLTLFEGDLVMEFKMDNLILFRITFTIVPGHMVGLDTEQTIFIGGSQGTANTAAQTRQAAKANNEISPATLLIIAIKTFAKMLDISTITGVSSSCQCTDTINSNPQNHISTYDGLWEANGASRIGDFYTFPIVIFEKDIELVPRHHRSRTRRKRQNKKDLYENLYQQWQQKFAEFR